MDANVSVRESRNKGKDRIPQRKNKNRSKKQSIRIPMIISRIKGFLSQRRCRAKVNSLKYNVIRDAFNCSCYSHAS